MRRIKIVKEARNDLLEIVEWYELQQKGLGIRFTQVVKRELERIREAPGWFLIEEGDIYKAFVPRFPHKILYRFDESYVYIYAIADMRRKPGYYSGGGER